MKSQKPEYSLEFLLAFDGRVHWLERGYRIEFRIRRIAPEPRRPHGLSYAFTLHAPNGTRLVGFNNAHAISGRRARRGRSRAAADHWHRTQSDPGRPYEFADAATLVNDFLDEVERILGELGIGSTVVGVEYQRRSK